MHIHKQTCTHTHTHTYKNTHTHTCTGTHTKPHSTRTNDQITCDHSDKAFSRNHTTYNHMEELSPINIALMWLAGHKRKTSSFFASSTNMGSYEYNYVHVHVNVFTLCAAHSLAETPTDRHVKMDRQTDRQIDRHGREKKNWYSSSLSDPLTKHSIRIIRGLNGDDSSTILSQRSATCDLILQLYGKSLAQLWNSIINDDDWHQLTGLP